MADFSKIAQYMENVICGKNHVPGCDIIVMKDHEQLYRYTHGFSSAENKTPLRQDALYYAYSCTKPMTATAGLRLIEEGKLGLDDKVEDYIPEFGKLFVLKDEVKVPAEKKLTVRHLFTMTGGFDYAVDAGTLRKIIEEKNGLATTLDIVKTYAEKTLKFEPGERFEYSLCHDILAAVIEVVSGKRFAEYLNEIIFSPLKMEDATFKETEEIRNRIVAQYKCTDGNVNHVEKSNCFYFTPEYESGGAGLITSVDDYIKFADTMACEGISKDGYRLLKPETIELLRSEQLSAFPAFV